MKVALTFDDGPGEWTEPILDLLAAADAKATFFVVGAAVKGREHVLARTAAEGHEVGNHTWTHRRLSTLTVEEIEAELRNTSDLVETVTGLRPKVWRAPHFDVTDTSYEIGVGLGMWHVGCDIDPGDWKHDTDTIVDTVLAQMRGRVIVDLHDSLPPDGGTGTSSRKATATAVDRILSLLPDGEFVTVTGLA